jgi:hypothetical protein
MYHQYWFDGGIDDYHRYKVRKTYVATHAVEEDDFGTLHQGSKTKVWDAMAKGDPNFGLFCSEILIQFANNTVCSEVERPGGRDILLYIEAAEFLSAKGEALESS